MKKAIISILSTLTLSVSGCNYLDINPEMGLDEDDGFAERRDGKACSIST